MTTDSKLLQRGLSRRALLKASGYGALACMAGGMLGQMPMAFAAGAPIKTIRPGYLTAACMGDMPLGAVRDGQPVGTDLEMLKLIADHNGATLSVNISEQFMCDRIRGRHDRQRIPLQLQLGTNQTKLTEAVTLMEANIEEPISLEELSKYVGVSRRQLERLFQKYLNCVPTRYYMDLRLKRARQLLLQTDKPIIDVALACGFVSAPHFSKCYRDFFGIPPRDDRQLKQSGSPAAE